MLLDGVSIVRTPPRERAHAIGYVGQNPAAGFVTDTVEEELAYGMEQLGLPPETMRRRVEETLDLLGIADLRHRDLRTLSGGQQQRVAIGSVLTMHPRLLVLDEPTSALDPTAAEEVLATLTRLVHDLGVSVLLAEHRLERVVPFADRMCLLTGGGRVRGRRARRAAGHLARRAARSSSSAAPPGWSPLPLSVRDARRLRPRPRDRLGPPPVVGRAPPRPRRSPYAASTVVHGQTVAVRDARPRPRRRPGHRADGPQRLGQVVAAVGAPGQRTAYGGPGRRRRQPTPPTLDAGRPARAGRAWCRRTPPTCSTSRPSTTSARPPTAAPARAATLLDRLVPGIPGDQHPRDLSEGQRLALALALVLVSRPRVLLLDEPTRGLDYAAKHVLADILRGLAADGPRGAGRHPRRRVRRPGRRRRGGARRGRGRLVRPGPPGGRRVAVVRAPGHQGARRALAARRRGRRERWRA